MNQMLPWLIAIVALAGYPAGGQVAAKAGALDLRLVEITEGNRLSSFGDQPKKFAALPMVQAAGRLGLDLTDPAHPYLVHRFRDQRCFYLFYNNVANVPAGDYLIQRIKKTDTIVDADGKESVRSSYLVEALKPKGGALFRPDQHFGYYRLREAKRRTITKVFEVGIGSVPGRAAEGAWPFEAGILFKQLQPYQAKPGLYDVVKFKQLRRWTLTVSFDASGNYELRVPELDVEVVVRVPAGEAGR